MRSETAIVRVGRSLFAMGMAGRRAPALALALGAVCVLHGSGAEIPAESSEGQEYEQWIDYYREVVGEYEIRSPGSDDSLTVTSDPVHVYHHPDGGGLKEQLGSLFIWNRDGRAEVLGALWSYPHGGPKQRNIVHEFHSLSLSPLTAERRDETFWAPQEAGIKFHPIPGAPPPAASKGLRLAQMRGLARQFTGYNNFFGQERQLRLTAQPLYRYEIEAPDSEVLDGAVFIYFMDWDPELILLVEARRGGSEHTWQYAAARFSDKPLRLKHRDLEVWTAPNMPQVGNVCGAADGSFYAAHGVDLHEIGAE